VYYHIMQVKLRNDANGLFVLRQPSDSLSRTHDGAKLAQGCSVEGRGLSPLPTSVRGRVSTSFVRHREGQFMNADQERLVEGNHGEDVVGRPLPWWTATLRPTEQSVIPGEKGLELLDQ